ncbi:unnamed protein product, partial [Mesorhabditis belari]|uniref:PDZ domain-containing protein n=1 Tax=Mesorhabditis belari TaxID=2138241 RepID=A0AAF3E8V2_9BILA
MRPRRVTVHFNHIQVVVPLNREGITITELTQAAIARYQRATGMQGNEMSVLRLELASGGILDPDDVVDDVLNHDTDQVLAICDDEAQACASTASSASPRPILDRSSAQDSVVEIKFFGSPPTLAIRNPPMTNPLHKELLTGPLRSSLKTEKKDGDFPRITNRVTLSPDVERRLGTAEARSGLERGSTRKSRISDKFYDAQDRLQDRLKSSHSPPRGFPRSASDLGTGNHLKKAPLLQAIENSKHTVIAFPDDEAMSMGIEVTGMMNDEGKLSSLQIIKIEPDGRVGVDGRLCVGDNIVTIDGRPVGELTQLRARALISDMSTKGVPTLTVSRPITSFLQPSIEPSPSTSSLPPKRPILSALQQANTQQLGQSSIVYVQKRSNGFGFTVTGRETARGERLFYIGTVRPDGAAFGQLKAGDRLIKINDVATAELQQSDVVERLKKTSIGASVTLEISRVEQNDENIPPESSDLQEIQVKRGSDVEDELANKSPAVIHRARLVNSKNNVQELVLDIPLNDTGSAGLGVSLKARVSVRSDETRRDCGIFVKKLLVGGAAYKDGRLMVDDQLISIEDIDLRKFTRNAEACEAVTKKLKQIGHNATHVRLRVLRQNENTSPALSSDGSTRITVDGPDATLVVGPSSNGSSFLSSTPTETNLRVRRNSSASTSTKRSEIDDEPQSNIDPFDREAPNRKSMSEKRGMGATLDPSTSTTYQKIRHQRQTSAPTSNAATRSFHGFAGRSASARAQARARSPTRRRSRSVDVNLIRAGEEAIFQENPSSQLIPSSLSSGFKNPSFKHAVVGETGNSQDISALIASRNNSNYNAEKQQRRKSMGSTMKNWFRIGNRSREGSPEKRDPSSSKDYKENKKIETNGQYGVVSSPRLNHRDLRREKVKSEYDPVFAEGYRGASNGHGPIHSATIDDFGLVNRYEQHRWPQQTATAQASSSPTAFQTNRRSATGFHQQFGSVSAGSRNAERPPPPPYYVVSNSYSYHGDERDNAGWGREGTREQDRARTRVATPSYYDAFNAWFAYSGGGGIGARPSVQTAFAGGSRFPATSQSQAPTRASTATPQQQYYPRPGQSVWPRQLLYAQAEPVHVYTPQQQFHGLIAPSDLPPGIPHTPRQQPASSPRHTQPLQPIFPTSRVFHATSLAPAGKFGERLSMRAKKKYRREIRSEYVDDSNGGIPANWHPIPVLREVPMKSRDPLNDNKSSARRSMTHRTPSYRFATSMYEDEESNRSSFILQTGTPAHSQIDNIVELKQISAI